VPRPLRPQVAPRDGHKLRQVAHRQKAYAVGLVRKA
jgi:hypothetical protein